MINLLYNCKQNIAFREQFLDRGQRLLLRFSGRNLIQSESDSLSESELDEKIDSKIVQNLASQKTNVALFSLGRVKMAL